MSAGKISLVDSNNNINYHLSKHRKNKKNKGFTLIEILAVMAIISLGCVCYNSIASLSYYYYHHKMLIAHKKILNLLNTAKNIAIITHEKISICPMNMTTWECKDNDWHNPIIIFYADHKNVLIKKNIILMSENFLNNHENINLNLFNNSNRISFDFKNPSEHLNGTIKYTNLYYNNSININRIGRAK